MINQVEMPHFKSYQDVTLKLAPLTLLTIHHCQTDGDTHENGNGRLGVVSCGGNGRHRERPFV